MVNKQDTAREKSKQFALRIVHLYQYLTEEKKEFVLSKQILRSGTSIGANLAESMCAISEKDFLSKIYIALKEADFVNQKSYKSMFADCQEIAKMLTKTIKTLKDRLQITDNAARHCRAQQLYSELC